MDNGLLKKMVQEELDMESKELLDLAGRVGYLDPKRVSLGYVESESSR